MVDVIGRTLKRIFKGEEGELKVLKSISELLEDENSTFLILNRVIIPDIAGTKEIDLLLLHPVLGIYVIEVKNWKSLDYLLLNKNDPFMSVKEKADLIKTYINENLKMLPINVEHRVVFPSISSREGKKFFEKHPSYRRYINHIFFEDDLSSKEKFKRFFNASSNIVPTKEQFVSIARLLAGEDKVKGNIIPILSRGKISFFDYKQLSVLNGYTGGFRIIRGVAGTGKTVILINFVVNKPKERILVLCFNKRLKETIIKELKKLKRDDKNVNVYSLYEFLRRIDFSFSKFGLSRKNSVEQDFVTFETKEAIEEFRSRLKKYLRSNPISVFLCDETQDMPPGFMRVMLEEIKNCIFFIDEGQKFYPYTMDSIRDVFYHPQFEKKISMRGRVRNLKTIYRTPSNIAKCALEILSLDKTINNYYRRAGYIEANLLSDIRYVLEEGKIYLGDFNDFRKIADVVRDMPKNKKTYVLTYTRKIADSMNKFFKKEGLSNVRALPLQAVKGLEADNIVIHGFDYFLLKNYENEKERRILLRKIYVLMTRAKENLFLSIGNEFYPKIERVPELRDILNIIRKYTKLYHPEKLTISSSTVLEKEKEKEEGSHFYSGFALIKDIAELTNAIMGIMGYFLNHKTFM